VKPRMHTGGRYHSLLATNDIERRFLRRRLAEIENLNGPRI